MRQAGRYMPEYRAIRKEYSLLEICKNPKLAAQVTIEAAEILKVDAAIIFADLLLPLEVMGLPFHFAAGEGPVIEKPIRTQEDIEKLRTDRASELGRPQHHGDDRPIGLAGGDEREGEFGEGSLRRRACSSLYCEPPAAAARHR